jgi:transposase InsO family protein
MGMPLEIHSDRGRNVDGELLHEVCKILNIRKTHTLAYHPQGNYITERENSVIKAMLSSYTNACQNDWDEYLPSVMMAYRSSLHRTLKETPNMMMFGREVRLPLDAMLGRPPEEEYQKLPASEYAAGLIESLEEAHKAVAEAVDQAYRYQKKQYDRQVRSEEYKVGQAVWLRNIPINQESLNHYEDLTPVLG